LEIDFCYKHVAPNGAPTFQRRLFNRAKLSYFGKALGALIRTKTDHGVIVILDTKPYNRVRNRLTKKLDIISRNSQKSRLNPFHYLPRDETKQRNELNNQ
jgi:hypothetical protein